VTEEPPPAPLRRVADVAARVLQDIDEVLATA
jgi:hypothetical protein